MHAFLSHLSACEALRYLGNAATSQPRWPHQARLLPLMGDCVRNQRGVKGLSCYPHLDKYGIVRRPIDLLVPEAFFRSRGKLARFHVWRQPLPERSLLRLSDELFASSPEFILAQMAAYNHKQEPLVESFVNELGAAREVYQQAGVDKETPYDDPYEWERKALVVRLALAATEFAGTYRLAAADHDTAYGLEPLMSLESARTFSLGIPALYGKTRIAAALDLAFERSASPMETALALMLSLPVEYGGFGLPRPSLNAKRDSHDLERYGWSEDGITPDLLWEDASLVIEYESDEFHASRGKHKLASDNMRANVLTTMGYSVLRADDETMRTSEAVSVLARQVARILRLPFEEPDDICLIRRHKLHSLLMFQR